MGPANFARHIADIEDFQLGNYRLFPARTPVCERYHGGACRSRQPNSKGPMICVSDGKEAVVRKPATAGPICELEASEAEAEIGSPGQETVRLADSRNADLVVMDSRRGGVLATHLPWSTLYHVVQRACCPVLLLRIIPWCWKLRSRGHVQCRAQR